MSYIQAVLDLCLLALLAGLLWRLREDPRQIWLRREEELRKISNALRSMIAQAEGLARELDRSLAQRAEQILKLLKRAEPLAEQLTRPVKDSRKPDGERLHSLLAQGLSPEEVASRLGITTAEARVAASLGSWRSKLSGSVSQHR